MKVVIFDMDGVLFDTMDFAMEHFINNHEGLTEEEYKELHTGNFQIRKKDHDHLQKDISQEKQEKIWAEYSKNKSMRPMFEGMHDLLKKLKSKNCHLAINTNAYNVNCLPILERADIKKYFDFVATADHTTDKVAKFKMIEEELNSNSQSTVFVTDALGDVRDAKEAGVLTIAVTWGIHDENYFNREDNPNLIGIVDTVSDLENLIEDTLANQ